MSLPTIRTSINCGSCGEQIHHDGEVYRCDECRLIWETGDPFEDTPAEFLHESDKPCGHHDGYQPPVDVRPFHTRNSVVLLWRAWTTVIGPCHLPAGHASLHDYPSTRTYTEHTEKP